jgi:hypothetical protein
MSYQLQTHDHGHHIKHLDTDECAGYVKPLKNGSGFSVHRALTLMNEKDRIATVGSIDEAVNALAAYYEENPPRWKREKAYRFTRADGYAPYTAHVKWTFYGVLIVERQGPGEWSAERNGDMLQRHENWAIFRTADEAKHVADKHMRDGFANYPVITDGYSWDI